MTKVDAAAIEIQSATPKAAALLTPAWVRDLRRSALCDLKPATLELQPD